MKNALEKYYGETIMSFDNEITVKLLKFWSEMTRIPFYTMLHWAGIRNSVYLSNLQIKDTPVGCKSKYSLDAIISEEKVKFEFVFGGAWTCHSFFIITDRETRKFLIEPALPKILSSPPFRNMTIIKKNDRNKVTISIGDWYFSLDLGRLSIMAEIKPLFCYKEGPGFIERVVEDIVDEKCYFGLRDIERLESFVYDLLRKKNEKNKIIELIETYLKNNKELRDIRIFW